MEIIEIEKIVEKLNDECGNLTEITGIMYYPLRIISYGDERAIEFFNHPIWCSEDDEREQDKKTGEYESLEDFLRREVTEFCNNISYR